eukprot:scaffold491099_cov14-Prasinocladus_malaysianus.AAC.1
MMKVARVSDTEQKPRSRYIRFVTKATLAPYPFPILWFIKLSVSVLACKPSDSASYSKTCSDLGRKSG